MLTNKQKYDYYVKTLSIIEDGWTKKTLESYDGRVCMVGAINKAVLGRAEGRGYFEDKLVSHEMQIDLAELLKNKHKIMLRNMSTKHTSGDGGVEAIELWNDAPWRRKGKVVKVLKQRIAYYAPLAREEEIKRLKKLVSELRAQIAQLEQRIRDLETRVTELENENSFLRKSKIRYTAEDLRNTSEAVRQLDDELNDAMTKLQEYGVSP